MIRARRFAFITLFLAALTSCGQTPEQAKQALTAKGIEFTSDEFLAAVSRGDTSAVGLFLKAGMSPGTESSFEFENRPLVSTPLVAAILKGETSMVDLLLKAGAEVNLSTQAQVQPLAAAVYSRVLYGKGETERMVRLLLDKGADVNLGSPEPLEAALKSWAAFSRFDKDLQRDSPPGVWGTASASTLAVTLTTLFLARGAAATRLGSDESEFLFFAVSSNSVGELSETILGKWRRRRDALEFFRDGTLLISEAGTDQQVGSYTVLDPTQLKLQLSGIRGALSGVQVVEAAVGGNSLVLALGGRRTQVRLYQRVE